MKKLFLMSCAALALTACTSEISPLIEEENSTKEISKLVEVSSITRAFGDGEMNITPESDNIPSQNTECDANIAIGLDIDSDYIVIADDFAIQNGDKLYENAAIPGYDHAGVTDGNGVGEYVVVEKDGQVIVSVNDICSLYPSYVGKVNDEGIPYINESGELTLVVYLWPGRLNEEGDFYSLDEYWYGEYLIGKFKQPEQYASNNPDYNVLVSAFAGRQGSLERQNKFGGFIKEGWSYIKVSIHISPKK